MKKYLIFLFLVFVNSAHAITIEGDKKYITQVNKCLNLLLLSAKSEFKFVEQYIGIISQSKRSGMEAWETPPRYLMSNETAYKSITWCASTIAHDAYHSYLYQKHMPPNSEKVPYEKWGGFNAERAAIKYQLKVLKKIKGSNDEINYLKTLDGTHNDTNKDGKLDFEDFIQRDW